MPNKILLVNIGNRSLAKQKSGQKAPEYLGLETGLNFKDETKLIKKEIDKEVNDIKKAD